jgi:hypothetical protein
MNWKGRGRKRSHINFNTLPSKHLCGGAEENYEYRSHGSRYPGRDSNRASHEHKCRALPLDQSVALLAFGRCLMLNSARTPPILSEGSRGFPQSLQEIAGIVFQNQAMTSSTSFQIDNSRSSDCFTVYSFDLLTASLNKLQIN